MKDDGKKVEPNSNPTSNTIKPLIFYRNATHHNKKQKLNNTFVQQITPNLEKGIDKFHNFPNYSHVIDAIYTQSFIN